MDISGKLSSTNSTDWYPLVENCLPQAQKFHKSNEKQVSGKLFSKNLKSLQTDEFHLNLS